MHNALLLMGLNEWMSFVSANEVPPLLFGSPDTDFDFIENKNVAIEQDTENTGLVAESGNAGTLRIPIPRPLIPTYYRIQIRPLFDPCEDDVIRFTVPGSVTIQMDCVSNTQVIKLHSKFIDIDESSTKIILKETPVQEIKISSQENKEKEGLYVVKTQTPLRFGGTYEIHIQYTAKVFRDRLNGMYLSNYTNPSSNKTEYLVTTHFESESARQLFPSFDEPNLKAKFEISVGRREGYNSLSNMNIKETKPIHGLSGWYWDNYHKTVKMSTYLIAVIVSKFVSVTSDSILFGGKPVKVWAAKHYIEKDGGVFAAETAAKILEYYQTYFNAKYPLPKMDSVAIPHFEAGAMENFGLNTYREKYLLFLNGESTESQRYGICSVVAHELSHQWFGDLVTCQSWSQLWLNEGFAAFVQNMGADTACPEFKPWDMFVAQTMQTAMKYDQSSQTHPLVNDSDTSTAKFSKITYNKGASLLRMMKDFLSEATFQKGIQNYLEKLSFGNAHEDDLFAALHEQAKKDGKISSFTSLVDVMESWTLKKSFPLVRVNIAGTNKIVLTQEEFKKPRHLVDTRSVKQAVGPDQSKLLWWIPIKMSTKKNFDNTNRPSLLEFWIPSDVTNFEKSGVDTSDWLIVNWDAVGYYRVLYDDAITKHIKNQLEDDPSEICANTRSQILDDYFNLAFTNYITIKKPLELTKYLDKETAYSVWATVLTNLKRSMNLLSSTPAFPSIQAYFQPKLNSALNLIGFEQLSDEKGIKVLLRSFLLDWACTFKDIQCQTYTLKLFREWMTRPFKNNIPIDIQSTVYCNAIRSDTDNSVWNFVTSKYKESTGRQKTLLLNSLACSNNKTNIEHFKSIVSSQYDDFATTDVDVILQRMATNSNGRRLLLDYIKKSNKIFKIYKTEKEVVKTLTILSSYISSEEEYKQMRNILEGKDSKFSLSASSIRSIVELIEDNQTWISKYYEPMKTWFDDQVTPCPRPDAPGHTHVIRH